MGLEAGRGFLDVVLVHADIAIAVLLAAVAGLIVFALRDQGWWPWAAAARGPWAVDAALGAVVALFAGLGWCAYRGNLKARREIQALWAAERAMREIEVRRKDAQSRAKLAFWLWSCDTKAIDSWSEEAAEILGVPLTDLPKADAHYCDLVHPDDRDRVAAFYADNEVKPGTSAAFEIEYRIVRPDGAVVWISEIGELEYGPAGPTGRYVGIIQDITAHKAAERDLLNAKDQAERAHAEKCRALAAASHDLRQPLHGLRLLLAALRRARDEQQRNDIMAAMNAGFDSIGGLLNTLLDLSELEAGVIEPRVESFPICDLLQRLSAAVEPRAAERGLRFRVVESSAVVVSDPDLLARIAENLLVNAVEHNDEGEILLGCRRRGTSLRLEVWDTGHGIPEPQQAAIFKQYYRLDTPGGARRRGLGLGLAIVDQLARLLGHGIEVKSRPGRGSMFAVDVPLSEQPPKVVAGRTTGHADWPCLTGRSVLVVDGDRSVLNATQHLLETWGAQVTSVGGDSAVLRQIEGLTTVPDLIIADVDTDGVGEGIDLLAVIRARLNPKIPALLITSKSPADLPRYGADCGVPLLRKPVDPAQLGVEIGKMLGDRPLTGR